MSLYVSVFLSQSMIFLWIFGFLFICSPYEFLLDDDVVSCAFAYGRHLTLVNALGDDIHVLNALLPTVDTQG